MTGSDDTAEMRYIVWKAGPVLTLMPGLAALATEFGPNGYAYRELGLDSEGRVIHRKPSADYPHGDFGLLDSPPMNIDIPIARGAADEIDAGQFEELWRQANQPPRPVTARPGLFRRLFGKR